MEDFPETDLAPEDRRQQLEDKIDSGIDLTEAEYDEFLKIIRTTLPNLPLFTPDESDETDVRLIQPLEHTSTRRVNVIKLIRHLNPDRFNNEG